LRAEDRQRTGAGAIGAGFSLFQNEAKKLVILPHAKRLTRPGHFAKRK
jgi:hypothetical protein